MEKYQNKYRIPSARHPKWDYTNDGHYFITITTKEMIHYFGHIQNGKMHQNKIGQLAHKYWMEIPKHFPFVRLGNFVVMPNHTLGILIIDKETLQCNVITGHPQGNAPHTPPSEKTKNQLMSKISPKPGSISTIIRSYKSIVTKNARRINSEFTWHVRFHDVVIRDQKAFDRIQHYIAMNPKNWNKKK